jgi:hypothetical protein
MEKKEKQKGKMAKNGRPIIVEINIPQAFFTSHKLNKTNNK